MTGRLLPCLAVLLALLALPARAQFAREPTAADLASLCESDATATRDACGVFLSSLLEIYVLIGTKDDARRVACPPRMMTADQMRDIFVAWAVPRTDLDTLSVPEAAARAVKERFPCSQIVVPRRK